MNRVKQLLDEWARQDPVQPLAQRITIEISEWDYARLQALVELYNNRSEKQVLSDLLSAMLDEVEEALPYVPGKTIVAEDEFGDPVYEDIGLSRKFELLVHKHSKSQA